MPESDYCVHCGAIRAKERHDLDLCWPPAEEHYLVHHVWHSDVVEQERQEYERKLTRWKEACDARPR